MTLVICLYQDMLSSHWIFIMRSSSLSFNPSMIDKFGIKNYLAGGLPRLSRTLMNSFNGTNPEWKYICLPLTPFLFKTPLSAYTSQAPAQFHKLSRTTSLFLNVIITIPTCYAHIIIFQLTKLILRGFITLLGEV